VYAVVETGGKQYKVQVGQTVEVELLPAEVGQKVELDRVLMIGDGTTVVGNPLIPGAKVVATVLDETRGRKILVFKYKPKVRYRRLLGHRQDLLRLRIDEIVPGGEKPSPAPTEDQPQPAAN